MRAPSFMVITGASIEAARVRKRHRHPGRAEAERRLDELPPGRASKVAGKRTKAGRQAGYRERRRTDGVMHELAERHRERDHLAGARRHRDEAVEVSRPRRGASQ